LVIVTTLLLLGSGPLFSAAQQPSERRASKTTDRATRPDWQPQDAADIFFDNAFEALRGERPVHLQPDRGREPHPELADPAAGNTASAVGNGWSQQIDADTLESQVKQLVQSLQTSVKSPAHFASGDFRDAQQQFGYLSTLFRVISEYDGDVRWRDSARAASQACARTADRCEQGTATSFGLAKTMRDDLLGLLNGGALAASQGALDWEQTASRNGWMRWIDEAEQRVKQGTSSAGEFKKSTEQLINDAQMLRMVARVLTQEGLEDGEDEDYQSFTADLQAAANQLILAVEQDRHEQAVQAAAQINQSCIHCHEMFKG
jgi:hypothetical protein